VLDGFIFDLMIIYPKPFTVTLVYHRAAIWQPLFIVAVIKVLVIFEHASILSYADDLKLYMTVETVEDCHRFQ
jgi:hypothetical protein